MTDVRPNGIDHSLPVVHFALPPVSGSSPLRGAPNYFRAPCFAYFDRAGRCTARLAYEVSTALSDVREAGLEAHSVYGPLAAIDSVLAAVRGALADTAPAERAGVVAALERCGCLVFERADTRGALGESD